MNGPAPHELHSAFAQTVLQIVTSSTRSPADRSTMENNTTKLANADTLSMVAELRDCAREYRIDATDPSGWIRPELALANALACERMADTLVTLRQRNARIAQSYTLRLVK